MSPPAVRTRSHRDVPSRQVLDNQGTPQATLRQVNLTIVNLQQQPQPRRRLRLFASYFPVKK